MASIPGNDLTCGGKTLSKPSPFAIHKSVNGIAGGEVSLVVTFI